MENLDIKKLGRVVAIVCPHDDDGIIGCGALMNELYKNKIDVYAIILTDGSLGYSNIDDKDKIIEIRKKESRKSYNSINTDVLFLDFPDMSLHPYRCWKTSDGKEGGYYKLLKVLREIKPDSIFIPNPLDINPDHKAAYDMCLASSFQLQEPVAVELGEPKELSNVFIYKVWDDLPKITHIFKINKDNKIKKRDCVLQFKSQEKVLKSVEINLEREEFQLL
jgi:LmbE family N-acetylglucosaminyl deacetylase